MKKRNKITDLILRNLVDKDKPAIKLYTGEALSYGELIQLMQQTQSAIEQLHIKPHERIALVSDNALTYLPLFLGIMENATCVPLDTVLNTEQYMELFELFGIDYLMCNKETGAAVRAAKLYGAGIINFQVSQSTAVNFKLVSESSLASNQAYKSDQIACVFTTSGTTSKPKVIPVIYDDLAEAIKIRGSYRNYNEKSIQLLPVKLDRFFALDLALNALINNSLIIYTDGVYPQRLIACLQNFRITHFIFQLAGILAMLQYVEKNGIEYTQKHEMIIELTGAPLPIQIKRRIEKYLNAQAIDAYGMSETGLIASSLKAHKGYKPGSVGLPVYQDLRIHDGEVLVKGLGVLPGYENDPQGNIDSFIDGWFRTGDAAYIDEDGYLFITGRVKELINRGGEKVSPYEVEKAILSVGYIKDVSVFPYPNNKGYENVGAVIVSDEEFFVSLREIRSALKNKIKPFKLPTILYRVNKIPINSSGKVQRSFLYKQLEELGVVPELIRSSLPHEEYELTATQFIIQEIWKDILDQEYVSLDDNFFDIGGDSLSAAELLAAIETNFSCVLPIAEFFEKSTIRELAYLVDETPKFNPYKHLVPIRPGGGKPPIFFIHERSGNIVTYHFIAKHIEKERPIYGLNLNWQREDWGANITMREVAQAYIEEVQKVRPTGPYYLAGLSVGGQIAFDMGAVLAEQGFEVIVIMLDTYSRKHLGKMAIHNSSKGTLFSIKQTPVPQIPKLIHKKIGTLYKEFILPEIHSRWGKNETGWINKKFEQADSEKDEREVRLRLIINNHQPVYFSGVVCYFRAVQNKLIRNPSYLFWKSLSKEFVLFETNCGHADFVKPDYAADTAAKIISVIARYETRI